jgi:hypothetical protein
MTTDLNLERTNLLAHAKSILATVKAARRIDLTDAEQA